MDYAISTHNGEITMRSPSGQHRTVRIRTQKQDANFAPGERIISLLVGSDNTSDYQGFGFVKDNGRVIVWRKHRSGIPGQPSFHERLALMVMFPDFYEEKGVEYMFSTCCRVCNRKLTTPRSIENGIGPYCEERAFA